MGNKASKPTKTEVTSPKTNKSTKITPPKSVKTSKSKIIPKNPKILRNIQNANEYLKNMAEYHFWDKMHVEIDNYYSHSSLITSLHKRYFEISVDQKPIIETTQNKVKELQNKFVSFNNITQPKELYKLFLKCKIIKSNAIPTVIVQMIVDFCGDIKIPIKISLEFLPLYRPFRAHKEYFKTLQSWWNEQFENSDNRIEFIPNSVFTIGDEITEYFRNKLDGLGATSCKYYQEMCPYLRIDANLLTEDTKNEFRNCEYKRIQRRYYDTKDDDKKNKDSKPECVIVVLPSKCHKEKRKGGKELFSRLYLEACLNSQIILVREDDSVIIDYKTGFYDNLNTLNTLEVNKYGLKWELPKDLFEVRMKYESSIYNFVLDSNHSINVNGVWFCTLGHDYIGKIIEHKFWGNSKCIETFLRSKSKTYPYIVFNMS